MKKSFRILIAVALSFAVLFLGIGYAQVTDSLTMNGTVSLKGWNVYITRIEVDSSATTSDCSCNVKGYVGTPFVSSTVTLTKSNRNNANNTSKLTLRVTVHNATDEEVIYSGVTESDSTHSNSNIEIKVSASSLRIPAGEDRVYTMTFSYVNGKYLTSAGNVLDSYVKFVFTSVKDVAPTVQNDPLSCFADILNDPDKYESMLSAMNMPEHENDTTGQSRVDNTFIGNFDGVSEADSGIMNALFAGNTEYVKIGNTTQAINGGIIIATNGPDPKDATEIVLYIVTGTLPVSTSGQYVETYAGVFRRNSTADSWGLVNQNGLVKGQAQAVRYSGNNIGSSYNSIWTNNWTSTEEYNGVKSGSTISDIFPKT